MPHLIIADDDSVICHMLTALLSSEGYQVSTVATGADLVRQAIAAPPDLILTDVEMPNLSGIAATCQLRANPCTATLPIIVQSGNPMYQHEARVAGATVFLVKPVPIEHLLATVQQVLIKEASCAS